MGERQLYSAPDCKVRGEIPPVRRAGSGQGTRRGRRCGLPCGWGVCAWTCLRGKAFFSPHPPPPRHRKQTTAPITRAGERHSLNVLAGKTFGEIIPWFPSPAVAGVSQAGMRGAERGTWLGKG